MKPERPTETIRFDTGISVAEFASGDGGAPGGVNLSFFKYFIY